MEYAIQIVEGCKIPIVFAITTIIVRSVLKTTLTVPRTVPLAVRTITAMEEDGICDPDCMAEEDPDCRRGDYSQYINYLQYVVLFIILLFVIIAIILFYKKIKEKEQLEKAKADYKKIKKKREIKKGKVDHKKIKERKQTGKGAVKNEMLEWVKEKLKGGEDPAVLKDVLEDEGYDPKIVDKAMRRL